MFFISSLKVIKYIFILSFIKFYKVFDSSIFQSVIHRRRGRTIIDINFRKILSAGGVMAGSVATLAIIWLSLQTMGYTNFIGSQKLSASLPTDFTTKMSKLWEFSSFIDTGVQNENSFQILCRKEFIWMLP